MATTQATPGPEAGSDSVGGRQYAPVMTDTETRIDSLREDIQVISETTAGILDAVESHDAKFTQILTTLEAHDAKFAEVFATLGAHDAKFAKILNTLEAHGTALEAHGATLEAHGRLLEAYAGRFDRIDAQLAQVLARLPA